MRLLRRRRAGIDPRAVNGLVALDVDGTIMGPDQRVLRSVVRAAARLRRSGIHSLVSTGRPIHSALAACHAVSDGAGWAICSNGALTARLDPRLEDGYEIIDRVAFDPAFAITTLLDARPDALCGVERGSHGGELICNRPFPSETTSSHQNVVSVDELRAEPVTRIIMYDPTASAQDFVDAAERVGLHGVTYAMGTKGWIDVAPPGVNKGTALARLADELSLTAEDCMAIGDGRNDLEMIDWAGTGVAMGNAPEFVRSAADVVTERIESDGAARAMLSRLR